MEAYIVLDLVTLKVLKEAAYIRNEKIYVTLMEVLIVRCWIFILSIDVNIGFIHAVKSLQT